MSTKEKRIVFISHESKLLGAPKVLLSIIEFIKGMGYKNLLVICPSEGPLTKALREEKVDVIIPGVFHKFYRHIEEPLRFVLLQHIRRIIDNARLLCFFRAFFKREKHPIIYANTSVARYTALPAYLAKAKLIWHIHEYSERKWIQKINALLIKRFANIIVVHSSFLTKKLQLTPNEEKKILLFNYLSLMSLYKGSGIKRMNQCKYDLLFSGKICMEKGFLDLLKAIVSIIDARPTLKMAVTGLFIEKDREAITSFIKSNRLEQNIQFLGFVKNLNTIIQQSKIIVLPTYRDYFPMLLMEALIQEKPVIATNIGDIPTIVEDGVNGLLLTPGDIQRLANAIQIILKPDNYRRFVAGTRQMKMRLTDRNDFRALESIL